jgi:hypothetical protein
MKLSQALLQTSILTLSVIITPSEGSASALKEWLDNPESKGFTLRAISIGSAIHTESINTSDPNLKGLVTEVTQPGEIKTGITKLQSDMFIYGASNPPSLNMNKILLSTTNYLPWEIDHATYLLLDSARKFYVTSQLSGCDVWIADHNDYEPLTIHVNGNRYANDPVNNLQYKEQLAVEALNNFNRGKNEDDQYKFVLRVSYDYKAKSFPSAVKNAIDDYWNGFSERSSIPDSGRKLYSAVPAVFYGSFTTGSSPSWDFSLKDPINGPHIMDIDCPVNSKGGTRCTIQ